MAQSNCRYLSVIDHGPGYSDLEKPSSSELVGLNACVCSARTVGRARCAHTPRMHLLCRHHCRRRSVAQFSQLCPPRCAETHSTGSHSAANRRAVPRHSSLSKWRRWYTMSASSSGHSTRSWISLLSRLAESLTVLLTGPRERIPSSSRNFFLQRTIEQLLEVEVPQRIARRSTLLSSVSWKVSTGMRLLVRSDIVQHLAWYTHVTCHRSCQQTRDKIVEGIDEN